MSLIGIPSQDQLNAIIDHAITGLVGLDTHTTNQIAAVLTDAIAKATKGEADLVEQIRGVLDTQRSAILGAVGPVLDEVKAVRLLLERLDGATVTVKLGPA